MQNSTKMFRLPGRVSLSQVFLVRLAKGVVIFLAAIVVLFTFVPSGSSNPGGHKDSPHLPQRRRIQQAIKQVHLPEGAHIINYRSLKNSSGIKDIKEALQLNLALGKDGPGPSPSGENQMYVSAYRRRPPPVNLIYDNNYSLPLIDISKLSANLMPYKSANKIDNVEKAQMTAIAMKEQGLKLTKEQEDLIKDLKDGKKQEIKKKITTIRKQQEKSYFLQLRARGQIQKVPSGGERILASPYTPVRFPSSLKQIRPEYWDGDYKLYLNLTHFPWAKTPGCREFKTTFAPIGSLKTSALASFPSSGNTWIRYLIESSSGIFTGSVYDDSSLTRKGLYGEGVIFDSGMTILQKTHGYTTGNSMHLPHSQRINLNHMEELSHSGVLVIRNPFKALISHRHLDVGGHTGYAPTSHFVNEGWKEFVRLKMMLWKDFYIDWLESSRSSDLHVVAYDDLLSQPMNVIRKIMKFLSLPIDENRLECMSQHPDGVFKRKPSKRMPKDVNPYDQRLKDIIYAAIDDLNVVLEKKSKELLPVDRYDIYDAREAKVARQIRQQRLEQENKIDN